MVSTSHFFIDINSKVIYQPNKGTSFPSFMNFYLDNIHCFALYGPNDLDWINILTNKIDNHYSINGPLIDCDKNYNQVIAYDAYTLTLLKPTVTGIIRPGLINENLIIIEQSGNLNIELTTEHIGNAKITITDLLGKDIEQQNLNPVNQGLNRFTINENLPIGIYICKIQINDYSISQKFQVGR